VRIRKVVDHRAEQLEKTVTELAQRRAREQEANKALEDQRDKRKTAEEAREKLTEEPTTVENWQMADAWLRSQEALERQAQQRAQLAGHAVEQARVQVLNARTDLRRIEALDQRLEREEKQQAERAERRLHDELAAQRFAQASSQRTDR
jgi:flagellar export protein FliJ